MAGPNDTAVDSAAFEEPDWGEDLFASSPKFEDSSDPHCAFLQKHSCPECNLNFEAALPESGLLCCPLCQTAFRDAGSRADIPPSALRDAQAEQSAAAARHVGKGCLALATLLLVAGGLVYAYHLSGGLAMQSIQPVATPPPPALTAPEPPPRVQILPAPPPPAPPLIPETPPPQPIALPKPPLLDLVAQPPSPLPERINRAIDRGVAYLRKRHQGHDQYRRYLALLGLTLLECGLPADDPSVQQIAAWLRTQEPTLTATYELALAILFLDRLNEPRDRPLIRTFGQRLAAGQLDCGAWTYQCHQKHPTSRSPRAIPPGPQLPSIVSWRNANQQNSPKHTNRIVYRGDNSNTQFALLGLWVAQRHGVAVRHALLAAEEYFRSTQLSDGSWSYHPNVLHYRDSMTCAGLMSLAMRYGTLHGQGRDIRSDEPVRVYDRSIQQGLRFLDQSLDKIIVMRGRISGAEARDPLYFLWSLERMAVIYDRKTIGDREWYPWAAEMLLAVQAADGSWSAPYPAPVGTCFALLVLRRSNLARDLQLAVTDEPPPPTPAATGPIILQGLDAILGATTAPLEPKDMRGVAEPGRATRNRKPASSGGVLEMPRK